MLAWPIVETPVRPVPGRRFLAGHALFAAVLAAAAALRVLTMLAYRPGRVYYVDSYEYVQLALHPQPSQGFRNLGYPLLLRLLLPFHSVPVVIVVQHVLGLATGLLDVRAAAPQERARVGRGAGDRARAVRRAVTPARTRRAVRHAVRLPRRGRRGRADVVAVGTRGGRRVPAARAGGADPECGRAAAPVRAGLPGRTARRLAPVRRGGGGRPAPLALYASWYHADHGRFALSGTDGSCSGRGP